MTNEEFNKNELRRVRRKQYYSKKDIMIKGKKVDFETQIKNRTLSELIYGDMPKENLYESVWENFRRYN